MFRIIGTAFVVFVLTITNLPYLFRSKKYYKHYMDNYFASIIISLTLMCIALALLIGLMFNTYHVLVAVYLSLLLLLSMMSIGRECGILRFWNKKGE